MAASDGVNNRGTLFSISSNKPRLMGGGKGTALLQLEVAYGVAFAVFAKLSLDDFTDALTEIEELKLAATEIAGQVGCYSVKVEDTGSGLADAPQIRLSE